MEGLRFQRFDEWVPGRKFPTILSIKIRMFLYFNTVVDDSRNISVFSSEDVELIKPDVIVRNITFVWSQKLAYFFVGLHILKEWL